MHEMGVAIQIAEIAAAAIPAELKGVAVERVNLRVGRFAAIVPASLRFCFEIVAKDTPLAGAELHIEEIPVRVRCRECGVETIIDEPAFACGQCRSGELEILAGRELDIESIEIAEEADDAHADPRG